jgi:uncharacterized protein YndB with AHSA1/START domain
VHHRAQAGRRVAAGRDAHAAMGFEQGWAIALSQLVEMVQRT